MLNNKNIWRVEDFIKGAYLENKIDNLQFGSISKQLSIDIGDVMKICADLEKNEKIEFQYDIRDNDLNLLYSYDNVDDAIDKAKKYFDENIDIINHIYISIKLTEEYKNALDNIKNKQ
ncbi:hypothetical protein G6Z25_02165 [Clostridium perfringens]|uniref:hypothetical protein n=1 Tax=Clostridium perfringens TaxID=1502 RepID=UPI0013E38883|nr:hypothetical protein [Clostridium perfringens]NGS95724.1 hypothetical protein [Clostridium perfringens]